MNVRERVITAFQQRFGTSPKYMARAPGRVNLLGEHVDYNDGFVLPAAIDRATWVAFWPSGSDHSTLMAVDLSEQVSFSPQIDPAKTDLPGWALYPAGMQWVLREAGLSTPGVQAVYASDVPPGSGLSSSASIEMAFGVVWQTLGGWNLTPLEMARLGQRAENLWVGVNCGIMDQFASACGEKDRLLLLDCRSLEWRSLPLPGEVSIVIADTTVRRKLTDGEYNKRRAACEEAVRILSQHLPGIRSLRDISPDDFNRLAVRLPEVVEKRARHVVEEIERTQRAIPLLECGKVAELGLLMNACHASLRNLYEVSCPELNVMVRVAQSLPGCWGARLTGAGFGGCSVNLVAQDQAESFTQKLAAEYEFVTGLHPGIYICHATQGAGCE